MLTPHRLVWPFQPCTKHKTLFNLFDEQAATYGLSDYFSVLPDNYEQSRKGKNCQLDFEFFTA